MNSRTIVRLGIGLAIAVGIFAMRSQRANARADEYFQEHLDGAHKLVTYAPNYEGNRKSLDALVDQCHSTAFEKTLMSNGMCPAYAYRDELIDEMIQVANRKGQSAVTTDLSELKRLVHGRTDPWWTPNQID